MTDYLNSVLDFVDEPVFVRDRAHRYVYANRAYCEMVGIPAEGLEERTDSELFSPEQAEASIGGDEHVFTTGKETEGHERIADSRGRVRTVVTKRKPYGDDTGIRYVIGLMREIADCTHSGETLKQNEEFYTRLVDTVPDAIIRTDLEGRILFVSEFAEQISGYDRNELEGRPMITFIAPEDRERLMRNAMLMMERRLGPKEYRLIMKDGRSVPFEVNGDVLRNQDGTPFGLVFVCRDTTERRSAEERLHRSEERFKKAFYTSPDSININRLSDGLFVSVNAGFTELTGYSEEDVAGKTSVEIDIWNDPADRAALLEGLRAHGKVENLEARFRLKSGEVRYGMMSATVIDLDGTLHILSITRDISERKRAEEEREKLQTQLNQAQKMESIGRLAGGVAHDFNNILTVILGYAQMAGMEGNSIETIKGDLKIIEDAALQSAALVRQLLAFARKQMVAPKVLDLNDTVAGTLKMLQRLIGEDISFGWRPGLGLWQIRIDPSQIGQLLANLCVNARDAITGIGRITIETDNIVLDRAYCSVHPGFVPGEYVMLAVSDNGCGMDAETISHIFEPFFTTKERGKGTGLGLATVYGVVKQNGGFVNVYSEPGQGSAFKIYLPRFGGEAADSEVAAVSEIPQGRGEKVLLVEDDEVILTLGKAMLETLGYKTLTAGSPAEALRLAEAEGRNIDLLITDVVMPEMNGRELAKLIGEVIPGIKCLFSSGYTANAIAHHGVLDEGVNFLEKPFSVKALATKVREALEKK